MEIGEVSPTKDFVTLVGHKFNSIPNELIKGSGFGFGVAFRSRVAAVSDPFDADYSVFTPYVKKKSLASAILDSIPDSVLVNVCPDLFVEKYSNINFLMNAVYANPKILEILKSHHLPTTIKREHVNRVVNSHLIPTMVYAKKIIEHSGERFSPKASEVLIKAALLHDIGKVLIPSEIINKKGSLTPAERKIIDLHSELGAEILKTSNLEPEVIELVANHHRHLNNQKKPDRLTQILTIADIYSALREKRAYKDKMENGEIFEIFHDSINNGELGRKYFVALKEYVIGKRIARELALAQEEDSLV